mmetsp:Transcript_38260/g.101186  ORF Transcript_38260/g.101186 Transcript_38260/m.101186 type:complete len:549 (+) Transcript_38260:171-1817(+)
MMVRASVADWADPGGGRFRGSVGGTMARGGLPSTAARPGTGGGSFASSGLSPGMSSAVSAATKLQLVQSPTFRSSPLTEGAFYPSGGPRPGGFLAGLVGGKKSGPGQRRSKSMGSLEVSEVRLLADDHPVKEGDLHLKSPHEALMLRLKSRAARQEAESNRSFIATYRAESLASPASEARLDTLLKSTAKRAEELRQRSEDLQQEVTDAERKLEKVNTLTCTRATDAELQALNAFERSQRRIQEDKREEDLQKVRDEVQAHYAKVHRRLQSELIELRDYKVLLREFRRVRLEKLHDTLGRVTDGRRLRACVREMIRYGAQRILQKMEAASLPLEAWMNEVLVNCCHVEIRIEEAEEKLLLIRRKALAPVKDDVEAMLARSKQERFESLCARAWEGRHGNGGTLAGATSMNSSGGFEDSFFRRQSSSVDSSFGDTIPVEGGGERLSSAGGGGGERPSTVKRADDRTLEEMRAAEAHIMSLRRLLNDMRHNAAAVICNQIRQVEKGGGREASKESVEWGNQMLSMLFSEDFAKATMKELQKSAPTAKLTQ